MSSGAGVDEVVKDVFNERRAVDFDEHLRFVIREGPEAGAFARGENDCLHG